MEERISKLEESVQKFKIYLSVMIIVSVIFVGSGGWGLKLLRDAYKELYHLKTEIEKTKVEWSELDNNEIINQYIDSTKLSLNKYIKKTITEIPFKSQLDYKNIAEEVKLLKTSVDDLIGKYSILNEKITKLPEDLQNDLRLKYNYSEDIIAFKEKANDYETAKEQITLHLEKIEKLEKSINRINSSISLIENKITGHSKTSKDDNVKYSSQKIEEVIVSRDDTVRLPGWGTNRLTYIGKSAANSTGIKIRINGKFERLDIGEYYIISNNNNTSTLVFEGPSDNYDKAIFSYETQN